LPAAAPEGVERFRGLHPDVPLWVAGIDEVLDDNGFILPGLGDAGDRAYGHAIMALSSSDQCEYLQLYREIRNLLCDANCAGYEC
jgi:hypothetical protein